MPARIVTLALLWLLGVVPAAWGADPLVVSVWGGNWKDTIERVKASRSPRPWPSGRR